jgi:GT2 family glycosyltransferase
VFEHFKLKNVSVFESGSVQSLASLIRSQIAKPLRALKRDKNFVKRVDRAWTELVSLASSEVSSEVSSESSVHSQAQIAAQVLPKPTFALCIPHRNRVEYLRHLLNEVAQMTERPVEVLIYDDASSKAAKTDLVRLVKSISNGSQKLNVRLISGQRNLGPSAARNRLAQEAQSDFLFFLDDDNIPTQELFEKLRVMVARTEGDVFVSSLTRFYLDRAYQGDHSDPSISRETYFFVSSDLSINVFQNLIGDANFCVRREFFNIIGGFDEELRTSEDLEFLVRAIAHGAKYVLCPQPLIYYRVHDNNTSHRLDPHHGMIQFLEKSKGHLFNADLKPFMQMVTAWAYSRENILMRGAPAIRHPLTKRRPVVDLSALEKKQLGLLKRRFGSQRSRSCELGLSALKVVTAQYESKTTQLSLKQAYQGRDLSEGLKLSSRASVIPVLIVSAEDLSLKVSAKANPIFLKAGATRVNLDTTHGSFDFMASVGEVTLYIMPVRSQLERFLVL